MERLGLSDQPPSALMEACSRVARETRLDAVYCPPVVPEGPVTVDSRSGLFGGSPHTYWFSLSSSSLANRPTARDPVESSHWVFYAAQPPARVEVGVNYLGRPADQIPHFAENGVRASVYTGKDAGPGWAVQGHASVYWEFNNVGYVASVHYDESIKIARQIARGLIRLMTRCDGPESPDTGACDLVFPAQ